MDLIGRYEDMFRNAAEAKGDGSHPDDEIVYEAMCYSYMRIDRHPSAKKSKLRLLKDESGWTRAWVAAQLLSEEDENLKSEASLVLETLSQDSGMLGFSAKMTLSEYSKGTLGQPLRMDKLPSDEWFGHGDKIA